MKHSPTTAEKKNQMFFGAKSVTRYCSTKKVLLKILQNLQENNCARVSFLIMLWANNFDNVKASNFIKKETLTQMFSFEFLQNL